jgi:type II secretion system protein N
MADGTVSGSFEESGKDRAIEVEFDGVDIGRVEPLTAQLGVPMEGRLNGTLKLQLPEGKASKGNGNINLELRDLAIGDGKAKIKGIMALPKLSLGTVALVGEAKDGVLKISKLSASGKDVDLNADGKVQMKENTTDSLLEMAFKFKIGDNYRKKNEQTKMIFGEPGSKIPPLFDSVTQMKPDGSGYYAFNVRGTLGSPRTSTSSVGSFGLPKGFGTGTSGAAFP